MFRRPRVLVAVAALALSGCGIFTGVEAEKVMGVIGSHPTASPLLPGEVATVPPPNHEGLTPPFVGRSDTELATPDTVTAGEQFEVIVRTHGWSSCWRGAGISLDLDSGISTITPWDLDGSDAAMCVLDPVMLPRVVRLTVPRAGTHVVRVRGRGSNGITTVERTLVVR